MVFFPITNKASALANSLLTYWTWRDPTFSKVTMTAVLLKKEKIINKKKYKKKKLKSKLKIKKNQNK
jgi:hypothetical protein